MKKHWDTKQDRGEKSPQSFERVIPDQLPGLINN